MNRIEELIQKYRDKRKEELAKSFPFDFGVVASMQKIDDYDDFIEDLLWLQKFEVENNEV